MAAEQEGRIEGFREEVGFGLDRDLGWGQRTGEEGEAGLLHPILQHEAPLALTVPLQPDCGLCQPPLFLELSWSAPGEPGLSHPGRCWHGPTPLQAGQGWPEHLRCEI